jgi:hypothetical protein
MNIHQELVQIRKALDALSGDEFQNQVRQDMSAFGPHDAKAKLETILSDGKVTDAQRAEANELREWLREECNV